MSSTDRQNRLLVAEDWKRIYQSFRNADFQSYDFENLRRVMISYIRENYPEDFNDYVESSEYLALIDLIAFLGQSIAFRTDLNARENFLDLAERRESVLRLAKLLSYSPKRNIAGSGLLKFTSIQTTQTIYDSNGRNLSGQVISWNDPSNSNWYEQFVKVINAALPSTRQFGNPDDKAIIYGIPTEQYRFQSDNAGLPIYSFSKSVDGRSMSFEIVSTTFANSNDIYEEPPALGNRLAFVYRNDGKGNSSSNTGFYLHFRQGILSQGEFSILQPSTNESVDIDTVNINDSDVWLYRLDQNGAETELWAKVPTLEGNNVIFNSLSKDVKNIYNVSTRVGDRISLMFSDGTFGTLPRGKFRVYYRSSIGNSYIINPADIRNVSISFTYVSNLGQVETLVLNLGLQSSVSNSSAAETNESIKANAPATYYTQNRMITGEDYNVAPLAVNQEVVKIKSVNRSSSGISRYFDLIDPTGKYSKTNLFGDDGSIYREQFTEYFRFKYISRSDIESVIYNQLTDTLKNPKLRNFYYLYYTKTLIDPHIIWNTADTSNLIKYQWVSKTAETNQSTGYIRESTSTDPFKVGESTSTDLKYITSGALVKFIAPYGMYFDTNNENQLVVSSVSAPGLTRVLWTKVISVVGDGTNGGTGTMLDGTGPIVFNDIIPSSAVISSIIPAFRTTIDSTTITTMVDLIFSNKPFGLRYDATTRQWKIVFEVNLNIVDSFSLGAQGDVSNKQLDSSWLILFTTDTEFYTVESRLVRYVFESDKQIRFYFDSSDKIYDGRTNTIVKDKIKVLSINTQPDSTMPFTIDRDWEISEEFKGLDGYVDTKKIELTFADTDDDGVVDNPEIFEDIVDSTTNPTEKYIVHQKYELSQGQEDYRWVDNSTNIVTVVPSENDLPPLTINDDGKYYYFIDQNIVKQFIFSSTTFAPTLDYKLFVGRPDLKFQYIHNADYEARIDPGLTNFVDIYVLTKEYDRLYRQWLLGIINNEPLPPSTDYLYNILSSSLNQIKTISDEIIYHPVKYKILFGEKASFDVQATFKVVKNDESVISDNDLKTKVLAAINQFFSLENWDFGDTFYFSELSAYVINELAPNAVNFVIVPKHSNLNFGSLFEIKAEKDQIFISGAGINDIEIISTITASKIKAGNISVSQTTLNQQGITSARNV